jgi:hypothetical protein
MMMLKHILNPAVTAKNLDVVICRNGQEHDDAWLIIQVEHLELQFIMV